MTPFDVAALTERFGVKIVVIEPGAVTTEMSARGVVTAERLAAGMTSDQRDRYDTLLDAVTNQARTFARDGVPATHAGRAIADAITTSSPGIRYTVRGDAAVLECDSPVSPRPNDAPDS